MAVQQPGSYAAQRKWERGGTASMKESEGNEG